MEHIVTFNTAKFLKSIGFENGSKYGYLCSGELKEPYFGEVYKNSDEQNDVCFEAPTVLEAVEWLEFNKNVIIIVDQIDLVIEITDFNTTVTKEITDVGLLFSELLQVSLDLYEKNYNIFEKQYDPLD